MQKEISCKNKKLKENFIQYSKRFYKTAEEIREIIKAKPLLLPCKVRLEEGVSWCHIDCYDDGTEDKITTFKA